jgi:Spy/CpxP family protein refolding chaperone
MNDPNLSSTQKDTKVNQVIEQTHQRVLAVLTPQQRRQYDAWWQKHVEAPIASRSGGAGAGPSDPLLFRVPGVDPSSLTDAQKNRIAEIRLDTIDRVSEIDSNASLSEDQKMNQIDQARMQGHSQVMSVLTPEQKQQFENWWGAK